ncbi:MAG: glycosyltransferase family 1 protein [Hyphomicrobiales bacterium]|nr:MAG: glycosyltransferase family 1 protein [Hyphomicrobiales bacterium]
MSTSSQSRRRLAFVVPGDLSTPTGGYGYDRRVIDELRARAWHVDVLGIGDGFAFPGHAQRQAAMAALRGIPRGRPTVVDGLALGVLPEARALAWRAPLVALVHQPLASDPALDAVQAARFLESERTALSGCHRVIATSGATANLLIETYDVPPERISIVRPGTDRAAPSPGSVGNAVELLSVGSVVPVKGYEVLIAALGTLRDLPWRLTIAGDRTRDPVTAAQLDAAIVARGLGQRVRVLGAVPNTAVHELYGASDLFVLASRFEGYGMALAEAISHGLPIVSTRAGAIPDTVPGGAGLLVPPDDAGALADALRRLIADTRARRELAAGARDAALRLPTWSDAGRLFADAIEHAARTHHFGRRDAEETGAVVLPPE